MGWFSVLWVSARCVFCLWGERWDLHTENLEPVYPAVKTSIRLPSSETNSLFYSIGSVLRMRLDHKRLPGETPHAPAWEKHCFSFLRIFLEVFDEAEAEQRSLSSKSGFVKHQDKCIKLTLFLLSCLMSLTALSVYITPRLLTSAQFLEAAQMWYV